MRSTFAAAFLLGLASASAAPVISELMFHPPHRDGRENLQEEWIEIHNPGLDGVNLDDWKLTGVAFTFPDLTIPPGGYLVVAADLATFQGRHPTVNELVGGWRGRLSNRRETVCLLDSSGHEVDRVDYAHEGDWAVRRPGPDDQGYTGWIWKSPAAATGKSMELCNPALTNNSGQNWLPSIPDLGTPGTQNSVFALNVPPLIEDVSHHPAVPRPTDHVLVRARITDDLTTPTAVVRYRVSSLSPKAFLAVPMRDDGRGGDETAGDGIHTAVLPARSEGTVVEFYLEAFDATQGRTWPGPTDELGTQGANLLYQVDGEVHRGREPLYRLVLSVSENDELTNIPVGSASTTNAQFNTSFIAKAGEEFTTIYRCGTRLRGSSSRFQLPRNLKVRLPSTSSWQGQHEFNLNTQFSYNQLLGSWFYREAGLPVAEAKSVEVRMNGVNHASAENARSSGPFDRHYGRYVHTESLNSRFVDKHFPLDPGGNLYRKIGTGTRWNYFPESVDLAADYSGAGWQIETNSASSDWTDLHNFLAVMTTASGPQYLEQVEAVIDLESWLRALAVSTILTNGEDSVFTGRSDDFAIYRGSDERFRLIPHDLDTILGLGDSSRIEIGDLPWTIFDFVDHGESLEQLEPLFEQPTVVRRYYQILRELLEGPFEESRANSLIENALAWAPRPRAAEAKSFLAARRADILGKIQPALDASTILSVVDGFPHTTDGAAELSGAFDATLTDTVLVNGSLATLDRRNASWSFSAAGLNPGINRLRIEERDADGELLASSFLEIRYDDGNTRPMRGTLSTDVTLDAASGPWTIAADLIVPAGQTLTIEPGASLYLSAGVALKVEAGGSLVCAGTPNNRIRLTRPPGTGGTWNGISFDAPSGPSSITDNVISYTDMEFGDAQGQAIFVRRSRLTLDHVTWDHATNTVLELRSPQLEVRDCRFPTLPSAEVVHGDTLTGDDYLIFRRNLFVPSSGNNDIIDFTGGRRPGPILAAYDNVFTGATEDCFDLDGADAHLEGNIFMNVHPDEQRETTSNAIATDLQSHLTVVRNLFYDVDHALLLKNEADCVFEHNTVVKATVAALNLDEPLRAGFVPGKHIDMDSNLFVDCAAVFAHAVSVPPEPDPIIIGHRNFLPAAHLGIGTGNFDLDPFLARQEAGPWPKSNWSLFPGSPAIGTGRDGADRGALVPRGARASGLPSPLTNLTSATLSVSGPGITAYRWRLAADGLPGSWSGDTPVSSPIELSGLVVGSYHLDLLARDSAGYWQEPSAFNSSAEWQVDPAFPGALVLSEVAARASPLVDAVELHNGTTAPIDLSGWALTDDPLEPAKVPLAGSIAPGEYLSFSDSEAPALSVGGETIYLYDGLTLTDSITWGPQVPGFTIGRITPAGPWSLNTPTLGSPNQRAGTAPPRDLRINEWLAAFAVHYCEEFVELYNPGDSPAPLGGLWISDSPDQPFRHQLPALSFIAPNGFALLRATNDPIPSPDELPFTFDAFNGWIVLSDPTGNNIDQVPVACLHADTTEGRRPDGTDHIEQFALGTPGFSNNRDTLQLSTILLPFESRGWVFLDNDDPPAEWITEGFDHSAWEVGPAPLGRETSVLPVPLATDPGTVPAFDYLLGRKNYYFRRTFEFSGNPARTSLAISTYIDDGAIFYLNGNELYRHNMPAGPVTASTYAVNTIVDTVAEGPFPIPADSLVNGTNLLAVVTFQVSDTSSDIVLDCEIIARETVPAPPGPVELVLQELLDHLRITEVMYNPPDGNDAEFIEVQNISDTLTLDLSGVRFTEGVSFTFPAVTLLPREHIVVVKNRSLFEVVHGPGIRIAGEFEAKFDNAGEDIALSLPAPWDVNIQKFTYSDSWYSETDGFGRSLELVDPARPLLSWNHPGSWRASFDLHGSPGAGNSVATFAAWTAALGTGNGDTDGDSLADPLEYALGLDALTAEFLPVLFSLDLVPGSSLRSTFVVPAVAPPDTAFHLQSSTDMRTWTTHATRIGNGPWTGSVVVESALPPSGLGLATLHLPAAAPQLLTRMRIVISP